MQPHNAADVITRARTEGRRQLYEHEGYELLRAAGIAVPIWRLARSAEDVTPAWLDDFPGERIVLKLASARLVHKTDAGGVSIVPRDPGPVRAGVQALIDRGRQWDATGVLACELIEHREAPGHELLVAARVTSEFGPLITIGPGGVAAEHLAESMRPERAVRFLLADDEPAFLPGPCAIADLLVAPAGGRANNGAAAALSELTARMQALAREMPALGIETCEINPVAWSQGRLVALDALITLGTPAPAITPRPLHKMDRLQRPRSIAIAGVSATSMNPGRVILANLLAEEFPRERITVIKPGHGSIDGCGSVPSVSDLPQPVDLLVLAVGAPAATEMVEEACRTGKAETIVLIPGGFEEKAGRDGLAGRVRAALDAAREHEDGGPLLLGGNCLGLRSEPGGCNTIFIPRGKLARAVRPLDALALVSQSGAFALSREDAWGPLRPRYVITVGNQMDLTVGDVLQELTGRDDVATVAVYVEGFRPTDGRLALAATRALAARGCRVVLHRAGRTPAGQRASRSHTAAMAGDHSATRALFTAAGAIVADGLDLFDDVVRVSCGWNGRRLRPSPRLGIVTNAGFECVMAGDELRTASMPAFGDESTRQLETLCDAHGLASIVDVHNPLDLTPMAGPVAYADVLETVLRDPGIDAAIVGCVPFTPALRTLPHEGGMPLEAADGLAARIARVQAAVPKPLVVVVDAGAAYQPLRNALTAAGLVVLPTMQRAMRAVEAIAAASGTAEIQQRVSEWRPSQRPRRSGAPGRPQGDSAAAAAESS